MAVVALAAVAALAGCKDPVKEEAQRVEQDRAILVDILAADMKAESALKTVGEAERQQKDEEAAALLETSVMPKADAALAFAVTKQLATPWGKARKEELIAVMTDRKAELPRYVTALRAHDWDGQLASVEKQIAIETRAMKAAEAIQNGADRR